MSRWRIGALVAALAIAGVVTAAAFAALRAGPGPAERPALGDPGGFVERLIVQIVRDDYARAWLTLHPAHKAVARRWTYVDCELLSPIPGDIVSLKIVGVTGKRVLVAGAGRLPAKAVTFELVLREPALDENVVVTHTSHVVEVRGSWRWILTPERYGLYRAGTCAGNGPSA